MQSVFKGVLFVCFLRSDKNLRILFVADPQLVGLNDEHRIFGYVTRWDSDK